MMNDRDLLAKIIQAEAGNQGELGMRAVAAVINNRRATPGYGGSGFRDVILAPGQFSPANSITGYARGEQGVDLYALKPSEAAYRIADEAINGRLQDPTGGALNFLNPDISQPAWLKDMQNTVKIGDHLFGTAGAGRNAGNSAPETVSTRGTEPMGLLGMMGSDDRDRVQPPSRMQRIGNALMSLSAFPTAGMRAQMQDFQNQKAAYRDEKRDNRLLARKERREAQQRNATIEALRQAGVSNEDLQLAMSSPDYMRALMSTVAQNRMGGGERDKGVVMGDRLVNPYTGETMADFSSASSGPDSDMLSAANTVRDDATRAMQPFELARQGFENISTFKNGGAVSDYALAVAFAKVLDPDSVAKEGEVAAVANSGDIASSLQQAIVRQLKAGEEGSLPENIRQEIVQLSTDLYNKRADAAQQTLGNFRDMATRNGIDPRDVYLGAEPSYFEGSPSGARPQDVRPNARPQYLANRDQILALANRAKTALSPMDQEMFADLIRRKASIDTLRDFLETRSIR